MGCDYSLDHEVRSSFGFNSRTPCGVRPHPLQYTEVKTSFNSRTPCGVRRYQPHYQESYDTFQFTHPVWGATPQSTLHRHNQRTVSIHAPRVGCDSDCSVRAWFGWWFQFTHPVWGATSKPTYSTKLLKFQFTHPVWGATPSFNFLITKRRGFNSRTPCGVRLRADNLSLDLLRCFNSRTPCGVRLYTNFLHILRRLFQFTHPVWGATYLT